MPIEPHKFTNLGGKESGLIHAFVEGGAAISDGHPAVFMQENAWSVPIYYQGHRPACGAHALAFAKSVLDANDGRPNVKKSPRFSWIDLKQNGSDHYPSDGVDLTSIAQSAMNTGVDDFEPLENDVTFGDADYAAAKFATPAMYATAGANKLDDLQLIRGPFTMEGLKQLIYDHKAVIALLRIGTSLWENAAGVTDWSAANVCPIHAPATLVGGHFEVMHSYDEIQIWMGNSFGDTYGKQGHNSIDESYLPYIVEIGIPKNPAVLPVVPVTPPAVPELPPVPAVEDTTTLTPTQKQSYISSILVALIARLKALVGFS
jgi:hypothetical protein